MVSIVSKKAGMAFTSPDPDSDDADSDHGNPSETGTQDSSDLIVPHQGGPWEMKKVNTLWTGGILILITFALLYFTAIIVTLECRGGPNKNYFRADNLKYGVLCYVPSVSMIMYLQSLLWGIFLICDQYIQYEHIKARRRGYLDFYNETRTLSQMPFFTVSAWCALLLAIAMVLNDNCVSEDACGKSVNFGKAEYALICVGIEGLLIIIFTSIYMGKVYKFNKAQPLPDVLREEYMSMATDYNPNSIGQVDEEIFQRQADVIRYLSEHNVILRRKVMELNHQLMEQSHSTV